MIERFLTYLERELNRSANTVEAYRRDLRQFAAAVTGGDASRFDAPSVTAADIRAWLVSIAAADSQSTIRRKTSALRAFYRWLLRNGAVDANPAADISLARRSRDLPEIVSDKDMEAIFDAGEQEEAAAGEQDEDAEYRDARRHIILEILYGTGLRETELLTLTDSDIDLAAREMKVTGKRDKQRVIPLPERLAAEIAAWQTLRDSHTCRPAGPSPLIPGRNGPMSRMQLYRIVREALAGTSATRKSPHTLRHSFATAMLNGGANLDVVKEMLGHASLSTTQIYTHLSFAELMKTYRDAHPRAGNRSPGQRPK